MEIRRSCDRLIATMGFLILVRQYLYIESCQYKNPVVEIRRSYDRLISTMWFPILVRRHLYIESSPWPSAAMALNMHKLLLYRMKSYLPGGLISATCTISMLRNDRMWKYIFMSSKINPAQEELRPNTMECFSQYGDWPLGLWPIKC